MESLAIATFILAGITTISVILTYYLNVYLKPKLQIKFDQVEPFCRFSHIPTELLQLQVIFGKHWKTMGQKWLDGLIEYLNKKGKPFNPQNIKIPGFWVRVKVENKGKKAAYRCVGKLVEIKNENGETLRDFDAVVLHWVGHYEIENAYRVFSPRGRQFHVSKSNKFEPINFGFKDYQYLDILWTEFGFNIFKINCPENQQLAIPRGISTIFGHGIYYLRILVTSDNANSAEINLKVKWNGNWDQIRVSKEKFREPLTAQQRDPGNYNLGNLTRVKP